MTWVIKILNRDFNKVEKVWNGADNYPNSRINISPTQLFEATQ